jgi:hypothetical protein
MSYWHLDKIKNAKPGQIMRKASINDITVEEWNEMGERWANDGKETKASDKQVGGQHYKKFKIQPAEFCYVNDIPYLEATAIKYLCRWKDKGGVQDLEKAKHFIDLLIEFSHANDR